MPSYTVRDPDTGDTLTLVGDSPPTEDELEQIFRTRMGQAALDRNPWGQYLEPKPEPRTSLEPLATPAETPVDFYRDIEARPGPLTPVPTEVFHTAISPEVESRQYAELNQLPSNYPIPPKPELTYEERREALASGELSPYGRGPTAGQIANAPSEFPAPAAPPVSEVPPTGAETALMYGLSPNADPDVAVQAGRSIYNLGAGVYNFLSSPQGIAWLAASRFAPPLLRGGRGGTWVRTGERVLPPVAAPGYFAPTMAKDALEQSDYITQNWERLSGPERQEALTTLAGTLGLVAGITKAGLREAENVRFKRTKPRMPGFTEVTFESALERRVREAATLTPEQRAQRELEEVSLGISPEEKRLLEETAIATGVPYRVLSEEDIANRPFIREGEWLQANADTGEAEITPGVFKQWLSDLRREGLSEDQIAKALRRRFGEEELHIFSRRTLGRQVEAALWNELSPYRQRRWLRYYFGINRETGGPLYRTIEEAEAAGFTRANLGAEVIRIRLQKLSGPTSEMLESVGRERWTLKSIEFIDAMLRAYERSKRFVLRRPGSLEARTIKLMRENLELARDVAANLPSEDPWALEEEPTATTTEPVEPVEPTQPAPAPAPTPAPTPTAPAPAPTAAPAAPAQPTAPAVELSDFQKAFRADAQRRARAAGGMAEDEMLLTKAQIYDDPEIIASMFAVSPEQALAMQARAREVFRVPPDEPELPGAGAAGRRREAVDETGVSERNYMRGLDRAKRFENDFPMLQHKRDMQEDAEIRARFRNEDLSAEEANRLTDRLEELELASDDYMELLANEEITQPDKILYQRLTNKPYNLTSEEVRDIINDYRNEGRQRLYEVEPGLGRTYDQARYGDTYRFFNPVEGDFQLYGEEQGPAAPRRSRGTSEKWIDPLGRIIDAPEGHGAGGRKILIPIMGEDAVNRLPWGDVYDEMFKRGYARLAYDYGDNVLYANTFDTPGQPMRDLSNAQKRELRNWGIETGTSVETGNISTFKNYTIYDATKDIGPGARRRISFQEWDERTTDLRDDMRGLIRIYGEDQSQWPEQRRTRYASAAATYKELYNAYPEYGRIREAEQEGEPRIGPGLGPAAPRRYGMSERGKEIAKLHAMRLAAEQGKLAKPTAPGAITAPAMAFEPVTPEKAAKFVQDYVLTPTERSYEQFAKAYQEKRGTTPKPKIRRAFVGQRFTFENFAQDFRLKFGPIPPGQLRELFLENAFQALANAPEERIIQLVQDLRLTRQVLGGGKLGISRMTRAQMPEVAAKIRLQAKEATPVQKTRLEKMAKQRITPTGEPVVPPGPQLEFQAIVANELFKAVKRGKGIVPPREAQAGLRLYLKALNEIANKLYEDTLKTQKPVNRRVIGPDEVASPALEKSAVFQIVPKPIENNLEELSPFLTEDARVSGGNVEDSRRLVALMSKETGMVTLTSVWDTLKEGVGVAVSLTGGRTPLTAVLKTHRPMYSVLLGEPVRYYRQRFKNLAEFNKRWGDEARARSQEIEYEPTAAFPETPGAEETFELRVGEEFDPAMRLAGLQGKPIPSEEAIPVPLKFRATAGELQRGRGLIRPSGGFAGPEAAQARLEAGVQPGEVGAERRLTDAEAGLAYDYITAEVKEMVSPTDVKKVLEALEADAAELPITQQALPVVTALQKIYQDIRRQNPKLTTQQALERLNRELFESVRAAKGREDFVRRVLGRYGGAVPEGAEAVRPPTGRELTGIAPGEPYRPGILARPSIYTEPLGPPVGEAVPQTPAQVRARAQRIAKQTQQTESAFDRYVVSIPREVSAELRGVRRKPITAAEYARGITEQRLREQEVERLARTVYKAPEPPPTPIGERLTEQILRERRPTPPKPERRLTKEELDRLEEQTKRVAEVRLIEKEKQAELDLGDSTGAAAINRHGLPTDKSYWNLTADFASMGMRWGSEWMVDRLRRVAPANAYWTHLALDYANRIISESEGYSGNMFNRFGDDMLKAAGARNKATEWMNGFQVIIPKEGAIINTIEAIEGRIHPPDYAVAINTQAQEANVLVGRMLEPVIRGFIANGGMSRNWTAFLYDVLRDGQGKQFERLVRTSARANNLSLRTSRKFWLKFKSLLDNPNTDPAAFFSIAQEHVRIMPRAITHLWTGPKIGGHWEAIIHSDLFGYFNHGIKRAAMVRAFREVYPAERMKPKAPPTPAQVAKAVTSNIPQTALAAMPTSQQIAARVTSPDYRNIIKQMRTELPAKWQPLVNSLFRALQGHPTENLAQTGWFNVPSVHQPLGVLIRAAAPIGQLVKTGWLSQQVFLQPGELLSGGSHIFFGYDKSLVALIKYGEVMPIMEMTGALDRIMYNNAFDPNSRIRSTFRMVLNPARKYTGQNFFNELQEYQAAAAAWLNSLRIIAHANGQLPELTWTERNLLPQTFRVMGFTPHEVRRMMRGDAELLGQMVRKAAAFAGGGHVHPAQQSRFLANRATQGLFWFLRYPATRANQWARLFQVFVEEMRVRDFKAAGNTALLWGKFIGGATAQGLIQKATFALFYGALFGSGAYLIMKHEMEDEPFWFAFDSFRAALGGPFQLITQGYEDAGLQGIANNFKRLGAPANVAIDFYDYATGSGPYVDTDWTMRTGRYINKNIPGTKFLRGIAAHFGLMQRDLKLEEAKRALIRWRRQKWPLRNFPDPPESGKEFRVNMRKAFESFGNGDQQAYLEAMAKAAEVKIFEGKSTPIDVHGDIQQSFMRRRLLRNPETKAALTTEEETQLRNRIGEDAYYRLWAFDRMLEHASGQAPGQ